MATRPDRDTMLAELLERLPDADAVFASWPGELEVPEALHTTALVAAGRVNDPRLVVMRAVTRTGTGVRIGWCLLGPVSNFEDGSTPLPRTPIPAFTTPAAARVLSLLTTDAEAAESSAAVMLTDAAVARQVVTVVDTIAVQALGESRPQSLGVKLLGIDPSPHVYAGEEVDLVCIGAPIWIGEA